RFRLPQAAVHVRRFQPVRAGAGPLDALVLGEPLVGHAVVVGGDGAQLVPHGLGVGVLPVVAEAGGEIADDVDVLACLTGRVDGLADPLDAALAVGGGAVRLAPGGRRGE